MSLPKHIDSFFKNQFHLLNAAVCAFMLDSQVVTLNCSDISKKTMLV